MMRPNEGNAEYPQEGYSIKQLATHCYRWLIAQGESKEIYQNVISDISSCFKGNMRLFFSHDNIISMTNLYLSQKAEIYSAVNNLIYVVMAELEEQDLTYQDLTSRIVEYVQYFHGDETSEEYCNNSMLEDITRDLILVNGKDLLLMLNSNPEITVMWLLTLGSILEG